jgi:chaperonin cofactor prefoldin
MPDARVTDVAVIGEFRADLAEFASSVRRALTDVQLEVRRAMDWITVEQSGYWKAEVRRSHDALAHAKDELAHARTYRQVGDYIPACDEEKKAVEMAKRRLEHAEQKVETVRRWTMAARHAVDEFQGPVQQLMQMLDSDIPHAMVLLERMSMALEQYTTGKAPAAATWEELTGDKATQSMAQPTEDSESRTSDAVAGNSSPVGQNSHNAAPPAAKATDSIHITEPSTS